MVSIDTFKIPWQTEHFNKGQQVFIKRPTGSQAYLVSGKFRGRGRRVDAWFKFNDSTAHMVVIKTIEIEQKQFNAIMRNK